MAPFSLYRRNRPEREKQIQTGRTARACPFGPTSGRDGEFD